MERKQATNLINTKFSRKELLAIESSLTLRLKEGELDDFKRKRLKDVRNKVNHLINR